MVFVAVADLKLKPFHERFIQAVQVIQHVFLIGPDQAPGRYPVQQRNRCLEPRYCQRPTSGRAGGPAPHTGGDRSNLRRPEF